MATSKAKPKKKRKGPSGKMPFSGGAPSMPLPPPGMGGGMPMGGPPMM